jgi:glycogen synthase
MNICFICSEYPPALTGGIGIFIKTISEKLASRGHKIIVIGLYQDQNELIVMEKINDVSIYRIKKFTHLFGWIRSRIFLQNFLGRLIKKYQISLIEDNDWDLSTAFLNLDDVPIVLRLHDPLLGEYNSINDMHYLKRTFLKNIIKKSKKVVGVSQITIDSFTRLFNVESKEKYLKIYNGVKPSNQILNFPKGRKKLSVLFVGTLVEKKGIIQLIKAWKYVIKRYPDAQLNIIGKDGRYNGISMIKYLEKLLGSNIGSVFFHGHKSMTKVYEYYQKSYLVVIPTFYEAFSLVPLESMANGCPTIYTKLSSGPEIIKHGIDGLLVEPNNITEISDAICSLLKDEMYCKELSLNGQSRINNSFNYEVILEQNLNLYQSLT